MTNPVEQYGYVKQPNGVVEFTPSPDEIAAECRRIRGEWSSWEHDQRGGLAGRVRPCVTPVRVHLRGH